MASKLIAAQHTCKGLLKFILPNDMLTVDMEVMTLSGVHIYRKDRNRTEKCFFPWSKENMPPPEFLRKVGETQGQRTKDFLGSLLNQDLEANLWPKSPCNCPNISKLARKQEASKPGSSQEKHNTAPDNIPITVRMMQALNNPENSKN